MIILLPNMFALITVSPKFSNTPPTFPTYFSNTLSQASYPTNSTTTRKFQHTFSIYVGISNIKHTFPTHFSNILFTNEEGVFSPPFRLLTHFTATFCCTHSPILLKKCSSIFIPLMVNCLMKSYAFSSFAFSVRFSAFSS